LSYFSVRWAAGTNGLLK